MTASIILYSLMALGIFQAYLFPRYFENCVEKSLKLTFSSFDAKPLIIEKS